MIKGKQKPLTEIQGMLTDYHKVLVLGCGTCVTVCLAGGEREVAALASSLKIMDKSRQFLEHTVKRQCEGEFLEEIGDTLKEVNAVLSLACGVGVQAVAERFPNAVVLPGVDTSFMGLSEELGSFSERCLGCGNCLLDRTAGLCPITRCAKSLFNGPCGGSRGGKCEISAEIPCVWQMIYDKLASRGELYKLEEIEPLRDWSTSHAGGPRKITVKGYER